MTAWLVKEEKEEEEERHILGYVFFCASGICHLPAPGRPPPITKLQIIPGVVGLLLLRAAHPEIKLKDPVSKVG